MIDSLVLIVPIWNSVSPLTLLWPRFSLIKVEVYLILYSSLLYKKLQTKILWKLLLHFPWIIIK